MYDFIVVNIKLFGFGFDFILLVKFLKIELGVIRMSYLIWI